MIRFLFRLLPADGTGAWPIKPLFSVCKLCYHHPIMKNTDVWRILFFMLCLSQLVACATAKAPSSKPPSDNCATVGKTHTILAPSLAPSVQGAWPMFHADSSRDGAAAADNASKLTAAWSYCTGAPIFSSPVVQNGIVYIASTDRTLTALDIRTGQRLWQLQAPGVFFSTPVIEGTTLYASALNGPFYAVDAMTGQVRWHTAIDPQGANIWSSPIIARGLLIFGTASSLSERPKLAGQVLALDAATGRVRWRTWTQPHAAPGAGVWSSPAVDEQLGIVYAATGDPDDGIQALSLQDGHLIWHWRSLFHDSADTDIGAGPTLYHDQQGNLRVVVGSKNGNIYSLDARTGRALWHTHIDNQVYSSPAFANGTLYVTGVHNQQATSWALSAQTGTPVWHTAIPAIVYASPAIVGRILYLAVGDGFQVGNGGIEVIDAVSGHLLQNVGMHSTMSSSPAVLPSWLFVGAQNGNIYAFTR